MLRRVLIALFLLLALGTGAARAVCPPSSDLATLNAGSSACLTDSSGNGWGIPVSGGYVFLQGSSLIITCNAIELAYVSGTMWYENSSGQWYSFNSSASIIAGTAPVIASGPTTTPLGKVPVPAPLAGTVTPGSWVTNQLLTFPGSPSGYAGMRYNYLLPAQYDPTHFIYPLMMVGGGNDTGMNGGTYPRDGGAFIGSMEGNSFLFNTAAFRRAHPAVIVAVQCDQTLDLSGANPNANCGGYGDFANGYWNERAISAVQSFARTNFSIDPNRLYWDGLSLTAIGFNAQAVDNNQVNGIGNASVTAYVGMSTQLYRPATPNANVFSRMTNVPTTTICAPNDNPCTYDRPFWQFITGNTNYPTKSTYAGGMSAIRAGTSQFYFVDLTTTGGTAYGQFGCLAVDGCSPGGDAIYNWLFSISGSGQAAEALSIGTIAGQVAGASFPVSGTISNAPAVPTLQYSVNGGAFKPLPAGNSVALNSYSFTVPGQALGASNTITVEDANNTSASITSNVFAITGNTNGTPMSPLPSGYLSVAGNQIIDGSGNKVRVACSTYDHPTGNYSSDMSIMRAQGFNCARFDLYGSQYCPSVSSGGTYIAGTCNFSVLDQVVSAATANNMKIVFDMHANELGCGASQPNGLWYDLNNTTVIAGVAWNSLLANGSGCISGTGGNFSVSGGYLIDPTGAKFIPEGPNLSDFVMANGMQNSSGFPMATLFPGVNYLRINVCNQGGCAINGSSGGSQPTSITYPPASAFAPIAAFCQSSKIACEFEDHTSNGGFWEGGGCGFCAPSYPPTGSLLTSVTTFWAAMATQFKGNPYAWIGSLNELGVQSFNSSDIARYSAYDLALYNAIRATGNNNIIDLQAGSGATGQGTMGPQGGAVTADYAGMTNIIFRMHQYSSNSPSSIVADAKGFTTFPSDGGTGCWGYICQQQIHTADGVPPMIINEWGGNTGDGTSTDSANIAAAMTTIQSAGIGSSPFTYFNESCPAIPAPGNQCRTAVNNGNTHGLTVGPGTNQYNLATFGRESAAVIAANPFPGGNGGGGGSNTPPTKTYATFKSDWTNIATHYKGNATVIALDLWHEPATTSTFQSPTVNWGGINGADERLMCSDTGAAVEAADPGVLVVCEGPVEPGPTFLSGAAFQANFHNFMDLTLAAAKPVTLAGDTGSHVVYSVHDFPSFSQNPPWLDSGAAKITMMNTAWGGLLSGTAAPPPISLAQFPLLANANNVLTNPVVSFSETLTVPSTPHDTSGGAYLIFWIGLQAAPAAVIQPVLSWTNATGWVIASYYVSNNTIVAQTPTIPVSPGTVLTAVIKNTALSSGTYTYQISFQGYPGSLLTVSGLPLFSTPEVVFEQYGVTNCSKLSNGNAVFSNLAINTGTPGTAGSPITPSWISNLNTGQTITCGLGLTVDSPSQVTFIMPNQSTTTTAPAPVWVGAMGASLDGSDGFLSDETAWASTLTTYMNGQQAAAGGPSFTGCQQPVGSSWYTFGSLAGTLDGTLNTDGSNKAGQQAFWSTLLYTTCGGGGPPPGATTWNPNDIIGITLSNANLTATSHADHQGVRATTPQSTGNFCAEAQASTITPNWTFGLANASYALTAGGGIGSDGNAIGLDPNSVGGAQLIAYNNQFLSTGTGVSPNGEKETGCFNLTTNRAWFTNATMRGNGLPWNNSATANPATGVGGISFAGLTCPCFLAFGEDETGGVAVLNAAGPFAVATPAGFLPWQSSTPVTSAGRPFILVGQ